MTARQELFVPKGDACELDRVTVCNESAAVKELDLFSYVEFCLWDAVDDSSNFQRNYSTGEVEVEGSVIYHKTEYRERRNHYAVFWANCPVDSFDTTRDAFCGVYGGPADPQAVRAGHCSGSIAHGWAPVGALHIHLSLAPGESRSILFGLGYIENPQQEKFIAPGVINKTRAHAMMARYATDAQIDAARIALRTHWEELLSTYHLESGEEKLNRMVNIWHQYQCMVTFNMSRSASYYESGTGRGMGFRDSCQDLLGFVHIIPSRARERILDIAATQFEDGSAYHQYQPLTKKGNRDIGTGFNDDPLWLIAGTAAYLRETGDWSILEEQVPFDNDAAKAQPLMEHLRRSFNFTCTHLGPHGLPLIGRADWNDCLNLNCFSEHPGESFQITGPSEGPVAESVFIAGMFVKYGHEYAELCDHLGLDTEASAARQSIDAVEQAVLTAGWDGAWFRRAYDALATPSAARSAPRVRSLSSRRACASWRASAGETGQAAQALASVEERLDTKYGVVLLQPAYTGYQLNLGEISSYPPGYKENAGIFCHNNPWISCAEATLGHGDRAFAVYRKTCPAYIEDISEIHRTEPYVYSQMVAGKDAPHLRRSQKQLADRHGSMDLLQHQSVHSGHPAHLGRPAGGPLHPPHPDRLHGHPPLPWRRVSHHGGQRRRGSARRQGGYRRRQGHLRQCAAAGCRRDRGNGAGNYGLNRLFLLPHIILLFHNQRRRAAPCTAALVSQLIRPYNDQKCAPRCSAHR